MRGECQTAEELVAIGKEEIADEGDITPTQANPDANGNGLEQTNPHDKLTTN